MVATSGQQDGATILLVEQNTTQAFEIADQVRVRVKETRHKENLTEEQTLVMQSGHPLGLFKSDPENLRVIITKGLMVGLYDNPNDWEVAAQMGVSSYGQMTAGGWMYMAPRGSFTAPTIPC